LHEASHGFRSEEPSLILLAVLLFPAAVYFLVLGLVNRRPRPVLVKGSWDCAGLLLACSGVLLVGGPALITAFYRRDVRDFLLGSPRWGAVAFDEVLTYYWWIWLLYFVVVIAASALLIWWRSGMVSIYNIEPAAFDELLGQALDHLGLEWTRMGDRVFVCSRHPSAAAGSATPGQPLDEHIMAGVPAYPVASRPEQEGVLDVEPFAATRHVSLLWRSSGGLLRGEVETGLRRALAGIRAPYNPAGSWFLIVASVLFLLIFAGVAVTIFIDLHLRRAH
jgi:hypothetical protein